jgi:type I restriction enzyme S subunit
VPWFSLADVWQIREGGVNIVYETKEKVSELGLANSSARLLPKDTVMLSRTASVGYSAIMGVDMATTQDFANWVCGKDLLPEYLLWIFRSMKSEFDRLMQGSTHNTIYMPDIQAFRLGLPTLDEQSSICQFISTEIGRIDSLIEEQQRLIELLKEKRQAVISQAVTKGLDPSVPMKDSGVEWLGEVPAHWVVGAVKRFVSVLDGRRIPLSSEERGGKSGEFPYYGASGIIDWIDEYIFDEDHVLVSEDGANLIGRTTPISFVARGRYWVNNHAHILKPLDKNLTFWAERIEVIDLMPFVTGSAQPKLTIDALANLVIAIAPDEAERHSIDRFIAKEAASMDELVAAAAEAMQLLQERRSALISAAVTGKIDVRCLQAVAV